MSIRPRVLLTVPHLNSTASPYREMMAMARRLPAGGFDLTVCALRRKGYEDVEPRLKALGVSCFVARFRPTGRSVTHLRESLADQRVIDRRGPFDIQHSLDFTSSPFEALMARLRFRRYVFSQRNLAENSRRWLLRAKICAASRIIAISGAVERLLRSLGAASARVSTVPLGLDLEEASAALAAPRPRRPGLILSVGQLERRKRHQDAIRALALLSGHPGARLVIAGNVYDEGYLRELRGEISARGLEHRVEILGPTGDVFALMSEASALLLCSEHEAFGWVLLEAMAAGLPVVSSASEGPAEIIEDGVTGLLVAPRDCDGYAAALRRVLDDAVFAAAMVQNARERLERRYSAETMVDGIAAVYRSLLGARAAEAAANSYACR